MWNNEINNSKISNCSVWPFYMLFSIWDLWRTGIHDKILIFFFVLLVFVSLLKLCAMCLLCKGECFPPPFLYLS